MNRLRLTTLILVAPVLAVTVATLGCGGGSTTPAGGGGGGGIADVEEKKGELVAVTAKGTGTLKGRVTFDGTPPKRTELNIPPDNKDKEYCLKGSEDEKTTQTWKVSSDGGVEGVVVWLRAPKGQFFDVPEDQRKPARELAAVNQPHCAFIPHVQTLFPDYVDPKTKKLKSTGQKFEVDNNAKITHNTNVSVRDTLVNGQQQGNNIMAPEQKKELNLKSGNKPGGEDLVTFKCNIHPWMSAYAWVFDHPYSAVTDKDGNYEIKNVPTGVEVAVVHWHETFDKPVAEKATLDKETTKDFQVK